MKFLSILSSALVSGLLFPGLASADVLIDAGASSSTQLFTGGNYVAGTEFTSISTIVIDSLGWLDAEGDGLVDSHQVGLWDTSNMSLLATATVTNGSSTEASAFAGAQWFLQGIDGGGTLSLAAGTYRVAGILGTVGDNIALSDDKVGNGVSLSAGYVRTDFPSGGFNYPNLTFGSEAVRATVGFAVVPEPGSLAILAVFAVGFARRRRH